MLIKINHAICTVFLHLNKIQKQEKPVYAVKSEDSGYSWRGKGEEEKVFMTERGHEEDFWGALVMFSFLFFWSLLCIYNLCLMIT